MKRTLRLTVQERTAQPPAVGIQGSFSVQGGEVTLLLTEECTSFEDLSREVAGLKDALDGLLSEAEPLFAQTVEEEPGTPEEIWESLSASADEEEFMARFNAMDERTREEVARHVLATQNVFKGYASLFSMRYEEQDHVLV